MSEFPILIIKYSEQLSLYPIKTFLIIIALFLSISTFIISGWLTIAPLSVLANRIWQPDFWQFSGSGYLYFDEKRFSIIGLVTIIIFLGFFGRIIYELIWSIFGISEFRAFPEKLIVKHQLFGISLTHLILRDSLLHFQEYEIPEGEGSSLWGLKAITKQKIFFLFRVEIMLLKRKSNKSTDWLGRVLADFYEVKFLPMSNRDRI